MWMPFRNELDDVFRGDRSIFLKMGGAGLAAAAVAVTSALRGTRTGQLDVEVTPGRLGALAGIAAVVGAGLALLLSVKDVVERRISLGRRVSPILRLYFGKGVWSLLLWFPTLLCAAFVVTMIAVVHK